MTPTEDEVTEFLMEHFDEVMIANPVGMHVVLASQLDQTRVSSPYMVFMGWMEIMLSKPRYEGERIN